MTDEVLTQEEWREAELAGEALAESRQEHPLLTTPFTDYTVSEGLLLLLLLLVFVKICTDMIRRAFSWLR